MTRIWPNLLEISLVVQPETILRWHCRRLQSALALEVPKAGLSFPKIISGRLRVAIERAFAAAYDPLRNFATGN